MTRSHDPDRDPELALQYDCSFCGAPAGIPCASGRGQILDLPHYGRIPDDHEPTAAERLGW